MAHNNPMTKEYPETKFDNLGRRIYVDWNGAERSIYRYWGDTKSVKIKYRLYHDDASFDAYDKNGKNILSYSSGVLEVRLPRFWTSSNGDISFTAERSRMIKWKNICSKKINIT
jgi:hypothetical protein